MSIVCLLRLDLFNKCCVICCALSWFKMRTLIVSLCCVVNVVGVIAIVYSCVVLCLCGCVIVDVFGLMLRKCVFVFVYRCVVVTLCLMCCCDVFVLCLLELMLLMSECVCIMVAVL